VVRWDDLQVGRERIIDNLNILNWNYLSTPAPFWSARRLQIEERVYTIVRTWTTHLIIFQSRL
jgi:hypothetical protein